MENTTPLLVMVAIVALCNNVAARPQDFKPSRLMSINEPGFFNARDAITSFRRDGVRGGRSFDSRVPAQQQIEEFKGQIITGPPTIGNSFSASGDNTHVVSGSYSVGQSQGVKQDILRYTETPGLSASPVNGKLSNSKKSTGIGKVVYGRQVEQPLHPSELYILIEKRNKEAALTKRQAKADNTYIQKLFSTKSKHN